MMRILIVDDSRAMQTIVRRGIEQLGYDQLELKKASNGKEALDIIRVWEPDLVISDWHMPEMTGLELLELLQKEMLGTKIKMGLVTTESAEKKLQQALNAGAQFIVQKPFDTKTLHEAVLPIIQGSADAESTLHQHMEDKHNPHKTSCAYDHIILPTLSTLTHTIKQSSTIDIDISQCGAIQLEKASFPYVLGLYGDKQKKSVHAIAIADINAACLLGILLGNSEEDMHIALAEKVIPRSMMENCQYLFKRIENLLYHAGDDEHLRLRSTNLMRKHNPHVEKLLEKHANDRLDVKVHIANIGTGYLSFIVS